MFNWRQASNNCLCVKPCVELQHYKLQRFKILNDITLALSISFTQILCKKDSHEGKYTKSKKEKNLSFNTPQYTLLSFFFVEEYLLHCKLSSPPLS